MTLRIQGDIFDDKGAFSVFNLHFKVLKTVAELRIDDPLLSSRKWHPPRLVADILNVMSDTYLVYGEPGWFPWIYSRADFLPYSRVGHLIFVSAKNQQPSILNSATYGRSSNENSPFDGIFCTRHFFSPTGHDASPLGVVYKSYRISIDKLSVSEPTFDSPK